jgi:hypothetical protein
MKKILFTPILAAALLTAACGDGATDVPTTAQVRFFNAVWNTQDKVGVTTNSAFAAGSALAYLQTSQTCTTLDAGSASFGAGLANAAGTALNSETFATLDNQTIARGGDYTILSGGNVVHPSIVLLDNSFTGKLGANEAAVRFVNLAGGSEGPVTVLKGNLGNGPTTVVQASMGFRDATAFSVVTSGTNAYTVTYASSPDQALTSDIEGTLNLQAGTVNTFVISRLNPPSGSFALISVPGCR